VFEVSLPSSVFLFPAFCVRFNEMQNRQRISRKCAAPKYYVYINKVSNQNKIGLQQQQKHCRVWVARVAIKIACMCECVWWRDGIFLYHTPLLLSHNTLQFLRFCFAPAIRNNFIE